MTPAIICQAPAAIDGDTIACANLAARVRLAGIDAPELHGCAGRRGRRCAPGDGRASAAVLAQLLASGPVVLRIDGDGGYGRLRGLAWAGGVQVNCAMLAAGAAIPRYGRLDCPALQRGLKAP